MTFEICKQPRLNATLLNVVSAIRLVGLAMTDLDLDLENLDLSHDKYSWQVSLKSVLG